MAQRQASNIPPSGPPFSKRKKLFITTTATWVTWNSNLGSSLPSNAATAIQVDLSIARGPLVWLNSLYMLGYAVGPLLFGPLSEHIGRRPVILYAYAGYMLCTMACALSDRFALLLAFRFLTGFVASAPNATGHSWQLVFWVGFAIAGVGLPLPLLLPETFAPVLERRRARAAGEAVPGSSEKSLAAELRIVFTRPAVMMVREPIVLWTALYLALVYSILYLFFQAYPVIFQGVYDLSPGMIGLGYLPILAGILLALAGVFLYDAQLAQYQARGSRWAVTLGLFWLGWSSTGTIHPALPLLSGLPFGAGYMLIFVAMVNHLSDAYRDFSASAHSAASTTRSLAAAFLPVAAAPMYAALGVPWACSLLGFAALALSAVPLIFVRFDAAIRRRSPFCRELAGG
ncbi:Carboxypeptidase Y inhibitor [Verticillium dahliae VDG2]|nr:Carboxypeptidase Y inhibitor [Verticillium dahliae VDG2]